jgi:DNA-binding CsgD family transcriptional regulator
LAPLVSSFVGRLPDLAVVRSYVALLYSELGRHDEARDELERLAAGDFAAITLFEGWPVTLVNLAEVCAALGDSARAAVLLDLLRPLAGRCVMVGMCMAFVGAASHYLGLLAATLGRWDEASEHFASALVQNAGMGARPCAARTAVAYAAMLVARTAAEGTSRRGAAEANLEQAGDLLAEARAIADELGMAGVLQECDRLQSVIDASAPGAAAMSGALTVPPRREFADGLTQREAEVLRLLATGASNREIADTLVVSVRTVERHLLHVYDKIGARRRGDAVAYALRQGLA